MEEFVNTFTGKIRYIAYTYLVDKSYIDDVVMNTFCCIFNSIEHYKESEGGMAWVCKIAQNEAYKINNRERKHTHVSLDAVNDEVASVSDFTATSEFMAGLEMAVNKLPEIERKIVLMRLTDGLTYPEIAERLNMYVGTVYKFYQRALKQITKDIL